MFGISPLGWLHTLGSVPAIPVAAYMFIRYGRIVPWSKPGAIYFAAMLLGAVTVYPIAHMPASKVIASVTIVLLFAGYGAGRLPRGGRFALYLETVVLSLTALLLMVPTVSEILRRVPEGHPLAPDLNSPLLRGAHLTLLLGFIAGLTAQIIHLRKQGRLQRSQTAP